MRRNGGRLTPSLRRSLYVLPIWIFTSYMMWSWWLQPERANYPLLYLPLTFALLYEFLFLPSVFMYFVFKAKTPKRRRIFKGKKVAVISLCVPSSESIDIVEKQLKAMSEITYPHDSWILDEGNSLKIKRLAKKYGVKHFSRKGIKKYNQPIPPFKEKTKAGNVNAWLNHVKRYKYEYFVQFDIDHLARPDYLDKTLGHFRDKKVAWVQAPSVYKNLEHWTARGAAEQELVLQGPLQMGFYGFSETPFIIGSHCTYRMSAIREIGGFQPTRAEDHLDTVVLTNHGYKGVFIPEVIAEGDGPDTLNTYLAQQFAWAYSMFQVLTHHSPKLLKNMRLKEKLLFLFAQTWYPLWTISYLIMFMSPVIALLLGQEIANVTGKDFITKFLPVFITSFFIWLAAKPLMKPNNLNISWRGMVLHVVRWPIVFRAILSATFNVKKPYMITPKGKFATMSPNVKIYELFLGLGAISALSVIIGSIIHGQQTPVGQVVFALANATLMTTVCVLDLDIRMRIANIKIGKLANDWLKPVVGIASLVALTGLAFVSTPVMRDVAYSYGISQEQIIEESNIKSIYKMNLDELIEYSRNKSVYLNDELPKTGIYNTSNESINNTKPYIRHTFARWTDFEFIAQQVAIDSTSQNTLLITIEPKVENKSGEELFNSILNGDYDEYLENLNKIIGATNKQVYVRFAHEMELAKLYSWGNQDPDLFISMYRYVVDKAKTEGATNIKWVWSPAGNNGAEKYYPGENYVDVVGVTVLYDAYWYGNYKIPFSNLAESRLRLLVLNKPIWVVEFGVGKANQQIQNEIIQDGLQNFQELGFSALVYLNIADTNILGPDYRLNDIAQFIDIKKPYHNEVYLNDLIIKENQFITEPINSFN